MGARLVLWLSLGLNVALLFLAAKRQHPHPLPAPALQASTDSTNNSRMRTPKVVVRRLPFTWGDVESEDYKKYIENLRGIACPEQTIRDIIVADVNHAFEQRKAKEIQVPEKKWWTDDPDLDGLQAVSDQIVAFENEKIALLNTLLGPGWQEPSINQDRLLMFDGPILSSLPEETKAAVLAVEANSQARSAAFFKENPDALNDPAQLVRFREQTRAELAALLPGAALEEYLLRYSRNANNLREELQGFGANSNEFRAIFRARDPIDQQLLALGNMQDPATQTRRRELERTRDQLVSSVIGPERFPLYKMAQDPSFRAAQQQAEASGAKAEAVIPIYQINQASKAEVLRINQDASLTAEAREDAVLQLEETQRAAIEKVLNP